MIKAFIYFIFLIVSIVSYAQVPQGIPYQAVARDAQGQPLASRAVMVRFSVLDSTALGNAVYVETHSTTTSTLGLFAVNVGMGTPITGTFAGINWGVNFKFMKVELDTTASGSSYVDLGTQQMMSVPYALYASVSGSTSNLTGGSSPSLDSALIMVSAFSLAAGTYVVPDGQKWKLVSLTKLPGFATLTADYAYTRCFNYSNQYGIWITCEYAVSTPVPVVFKINNDNFPVTINGTVSQYQVNGTWDCTQCPPTQTQPNGYSVNLTEIQFPIWLNEGESIQIGDKLRLSVEVYK